ncbi:MAG TPA: DMT family transporter [Mycobacteriales bacterium]|nr:DMT family transporter [Mycobacteriales bacterium]
MPGVLVRPTSVDTGLMLIAVVAISSSGPLIAATAAPALAIAFWRNGFSSGVLAPWALISRRRELAGASRRTLLTAAGAGALLAVHFGTWVPSLSLTSVASSTALVTAQPVWAALLARASGHAVSRGVWVGIGASVVGAALVAGVDVEVSSRAFAGDVLALIGGCAGAFYVALGGSARKRLSTVSYTAICYSVCAVLLLMACLIGGVRLAGYGANSWLKLLALTAGAQLLGHSLLNVALRSTTATVVSLVVLAEVPGAALIAAVWLGQVPSATAWPGFALLVLGAAVVVRCGVRSEQANP